MSRGNGALLGMIVDRSSFDDDEMSRSCVSFEDGGERRKNGRVRRKLKWKPPSLSLRRKQHSSNESIRTVGERSARSSKTSQSFHTFSSTETPVLSNKKRQKPPTTMPRPNYPDTFEGVSTIENEARLVHSRMAHYDNNLSRSHTMPSRYEDIDLVGSQSDSDSFDPYGTDSYSASTHPGFDPFGVKPKPATKPSLRALARSAAKRNPRMSERPPVHQISRPPKAFQTKEKGELTDSLSSEEIPMEESFPVLTGDDFEPDRRIDLMSSFVTSTSHSSSSATDVDLGFGLSPIKVSPVKRQVTPESRALDRKSPTTSPKKSVQNKHIAEPVLARVDIDRNSPMNLGTMIQSSGTHSEQKTSICVSPARRAYNRPHNSMTIAFNDSPGSTRFDDTMSTRTPPESPDVTIISGTGVEQVAGSFPSAYRTDEMSGARRTPSPRPSRSSTGPVDVDQGQFLEAERNLKAIHQMAAEHLAHGEYEEALEVFEEILRGQRERYGDRHYRVGTALHNIGIVHLKSKNYDKAIKVCKEAVRVRKEALVPNHPDVAVSLAQLGVAHLECQQNREALIAFREALQIRREFLGPKHPKVGKILNNVGCALYELDELEGAKFAFEEALEIQRETLRTSPVVDEEEMGAFSNQALLSIASTLCNLGSIELRRGNFEDANVALEEALLVSSQLIRSYSQAVVVVLF